MMAVFGLHKNRVNIDQQEEVNGDKVDMLNISTSSASIEVLTGSGNEIDILLKGEMSEQQAKNYEFKVVQKERILNISFKATNHSTGFQFGSIGHVKLRVTIPKKHYNDVQVGTSSGSIAITKIEPESLTSTSSSGSQKVSELKITNRLFAKASSGSVVANGNHAGSAMLRASSGSIKLKLLVCDNVKLETSSGSIVYHNDTISGVLECNASSGSINLQTDQIPESLSVACKANSGSVNVKLDGMEFKEKTSHRAIASRGAGDNRIFARTSSGSIKVL